MASKLSTQVPIQPNVTLSNYNTYKRCILTSSAFSLTYHKYFSTSVPLMVSCFVVMVRGHAMK